MLEGNASSWPGLRAPDPPEALCPQQPWQPLLQTLSSNGAREEVATHPRAHPSG